MSDTLKEVKHKLESGEEENYEHRYFVPFSHLRRVLRRPVIRSLLDESGIEFYELNELVNRIAHGGLRLLGVLVYIDAVAAVKKFQELDHSLKQNLDARLPLDEVVIESIIPTAATRKTFLKRQWTFLTPVLRPDQSLRRLDEKTILPFTGSTPVAESGFSTVTRVTLEHLGPGESRPDYRVKLIRKTLTRVKDESDIETDFAHELHILSCLRHIKHPSIIQLVTAFTIGRSYNFLLPEADGDLHSLMLSTDGMPGLRSEDEIIQSLWSLSSALAAVHDYFVSDYGIRRVGCHYDIKPRNILCLRGRLILTDFGLSRLVEEEATSRTLFKQGEGWYLAPECNPSDRDFEPGKIGRSSDVWSFGCVLSEVLAYIAAAEGDGPSSVKQYRCNRRIKLTHIRGEYFHGDTDVNAQVVAFLRSFSHEQDSIDPARRSLAEVIQDMLKFIPDERLSVGHVTQSLFRIPLLTEYRYITSQHFDDPDLTVELESLRLWGDEIGLCQRPDGRCELHGWMQQLHSWQELQEVERLVHEYAQEVKTLRSQDLPPLTSGFSAAYNLRRLGDMLYSLLPCECREMLSRHLEDYLLDRNLADKQVTNTADEGAQITIIPSSQLRINMQRLALLSTTRNIAELESECSEEQLRYNLSALRQPFEIFHAHHMSTVIATGSRVLVELLEYKEDWKNRVLELRSRVRAIASLRHHDAPSEAFPILRSEGYYHSKKGHHFGLVYALPAFAANTQPSSLIHIITATTSRAHQPSLTQKFKLAHLLASYVLTLHRGGWVHKRIAALNVIFFPEVFRSPNSNSGSKSSASNAATASLARPFFIGFSHGREDVETAFSQGPIEIENELKEYQHPLYLKGTTAAGAGAAENCSSKGTLQLPFHRYRLEFDYYSTGLMLLEIALWKPLSHITKRIQGSPEEVQRQLLRDHVPMLKTYMGDIYAECVRSSLEMCNGDGTAGVPITTRSSEQARAVFAAEVVQKLAAVVV